LTFKFLIELVGAERALLGIALPFDMADTHFSDHLLRLDGDAESLEAFYSKNAIRLLGSITGEGEGESRRIAHQAWTSWQGHISYIL
jgi:hypothetical protein